MNPRALLLHACTELTEILLRKDLGYMLPYFVLHFQVNESANASDIFSTLQYKHVP